MFNQDRAWTVDKNKPTKRSITIPTIKTFNIHKNLN